MEGSGCHQQQVADNSASQEFTRSNIQSCGITNSFNNKGSGYQGFTDVVIRSDDSSLPGWVRDILVKFGMRDLFNNNENRPQTFHGVSFSYFISSIYSRLQALPQGVARTLTSCGSCSRNSFLNNGRGEQNFQDSNIESDSCACVRNGCSSNNTGVYRGGGGRQNFKGTNIINGAIVRSATDNIHCAGTYNSFNNGITV